MFVENKHLIVSGCVQLETWNHESETLNLELDYANHLLKKNYTPLIK